MNPAFCCVQSQTTCLNSERLQVLQTCLDPVHSSKTGRFRDALFIAIDAGLDSSKRLATIGIACLDTRLLMGSCVGNSLTTRLLLQTRRSLPKTKWVRQYLYGTPEYSPPEKARETLQIIFEQVDLQYGGFRNIVLVGHDVRCDIKILQNHLNIDLTMTPSIVATIDTQQLASHIFRMRYQQISLKSTLSTLGLEARQLHNSGNDAVYSLKAMILLSCIHQNALADQTAVQGTLGNGEKEDWIQTEPTQHGRMGLLRQLALTCPPKMSRRDVKWGQRIRPARSVNSDMLDVDASSEEDMQSTFTTMFNKKEL